MAASLTYELMTFNTKDHQEAVKAFVEKRNPISSGKRSKPLRTTQIVSTDETPRLHRLWFLKT